MDQIIIVTEPNQIVIEDTTERVIATAPNNVVVTDTEIQIIQPAPSPNIVQVVDTGNVVYAPILQANVISVGIQGAPGAPGTSSGVLVTEVPLGVINGSNVEFSLSHSAQALILFQNGLALSQGNEFTIAGTVITFIEAPLGGDTLFSLYSY